MLMWVTFTFRYSIISGNERMTFMIDSDTGVLSLSNKRRQGMKPVYQLNVSVSDGVFTNTAQVRRRLCICGPLQSAPPPPPTPDPRYRFIRRICSFSIWTNVSWRSALQLEVNVLSCHIRFAYRDEVSAGSKYVHLCLCCLPGNTIVNTKFWPDSTKLIDFSCALYVTWWRGKKNRTEK